jgi:hypothetical protein
MNDKEKHNEIRSLFEEQITWKKKKTRENMQEPEEDRMDEEVHGKI